MNSDEKLIYLWRTNREEVKKLINKDKVRLINLLLEDE